MPGLYPKTSARRPAGPSVDAGGSGRRVRIAAPAAAAGLAGIGLALYANALHAPFVLDDQTAIVENLRVARISSFLPPLGPRDVGFLTFALNYNLSRFDTFSYHLVNVAVHVVNAFLVFALCRRLLERFPGDGRGDDGIAAGAAALLFLVHPVQTGAVTYVVQRFASLATLFYLLSVVSFIDASRRYAAGERFLSRGHLARYLLSVAAALLAMKTKETAFTLPLAILLCERFLRRGAPAGERGKPVSYFLAPLLTILVIPAEILGARSGIGDLAGAVGRGTLSTADIGRWDYLLTQARVVATYLGLLVFPAGQNVDHDYPISRSILDPGVLPCAALHAGLIAAALLLFRRARRGPALLASFGILWFYLTLSVESGLIPIDDVIFEHRLYLPSAGMIPAAVAALYAWAGRVPGPGGRRAFVALVAVAAALLSALTVARNALWSDGLGIWEDSVRKSPKKARPHANLGDAYAARGMFEEAAGEYRKALEIAPSLAEIRNSMGNVYRSRGALPAAIAEYRAAVAQRPSFAVGWYSLGAALSEAGRKGEALESLRRAAALAPEMYEAHVSIGNILDSLGDRGGALAAYARALAINPDAESAWFNRGVLYEAAGDTDSARRDYERALALSPSFQAARERLARLARSPAPGRGAPR